MSNWIQLNDDPMQTFSTWFELAQEAGNFEPTQMTLATVDATGMPAARVVLLKKHDSTGLCFFTNYESSKAEQISNSDKVALVFHWEKPEHRQIRVRGLVEKLSKEESNNYFQTRHRGSQIGAWASPQSRPIESRHELIHNNKRYEEQFSDDEVVPCPPHWGGYRVKPLSLEFWQAGEFRLHDRVRFKRSTVVEPWQSIYLAP